MPFAFPAVLVGGPPQSGKSVFTYALKRVLWQYRPRPAFYVLRAAPDGEGDWFHEGTPALVHQLRFKHTFDRDFAEKVAGAIASRHLPLLVDVGGKITAEQRLIARQCTHAILVSADPDQLKAWEAFVAEMGLTLLASFHSRLEGQDEVEDPDALPLRGTVTRLSRHVRADERPAVDAVARRLRSLFAYDHETLRDMHRKQLPPGVSLVDLQTWPPDGWWEPHMLPNLVGELPKGPLALYGAAPTWAFGAVAAATTESLCQFDAAWGWMEPPALVVNGEPACEFRLTRKGADVLFLEVRLPGGYVLPEELDGSGVPPVPAEAGLIVSGKLPLWLYTALVRAYAPLVRWVAIYQPQQEGAVVVASRDRLWPVGARVPLEGTGLKY